jgi:hypothetical protein
MRAIFRRLLVSFLFAVPLCALASDIPQDLNALRVRQAEIKAGLEAHSTGVYKEMSAQSRAELLARQSAMLALLEGKQAASELTDNQQAQVAQTIAWIDTELKQAGDERMVCERRQILGSNRKERVCMTAAQMRAQRDAARDRMDRRSICDDCKGN